MKKNYEPVFFSSGKSVMPDPAFKYNDQQFVC